MANREAIRELQARLAARLQAVQDGDNPAQWLAVHAGPAHYLLPLAQAGEIYPLAGLQAVPHTRAWFLGVLNIRGSLYGVVDLQGYYVPGPVTAWGAGDVAGAPPSVITLNPGLEMNCALAVGALAGLRGSSDFESTQPPDAAAPPGWGRRHTDAQGLVWQEINLQALSGDSGFLNICA